MPNETDRTVAIAVSADTTGLEQGLGDAARSGQQFARVLSTALTDAAIKGKSFGDVLQSLATRLSGLALQAAAPAIQQGLGGLFSGLLGGGTGGDGWSTGAARPASSLAAPAPGPSIVFNVASPDAESFRRSEAQVAAMVSRAADYGTRNL